MAANYNCLLLDVDGTLLDFSQAEEEAIRGTLEAFELPCDDAACALYSRINADLWAQLERGEIKKDALTKQRFIRLLKDLGEKRDAIRMNNEYMTRLSQGAHMIPGADELLAELGEFATLAAVSNGNYRTLMARLEKSGLLPYFDGVFASEKLGASKPSPKVFGTVLGRLGIEKSRSRVLVIGDSLAADIQGGINAGLDTCWCNFDKAENTTGIQPTHTVHSYTELKLVAIGEEELQLAATREKRHLL